MNLDGKSEIIQIGSNLEASMEQLIWKLADFTTGFQCCQCFCESLWQFRWQDQDALRQEAAGLLLRAAEDGTLEAPRYYLHNSELVQVKSCQVSGSTR